MLLLFLAQILDPTAWGGNHVGKPVPEYIHGDECLFCHRNDIGPTWQRNRHGVAIRQREDAPDLQQLAKDVPGVEFFLGSRDRVRFLKRAGFGRFAIWSDGKWDAEKFAAGCAGCHATGVDSKTRAFSAFGIDCYACHGDVDLNHTKDTSLIWLSKKRRDDARALTSICAQCHLRGGVSRSTGLPYANNFVAGDNLFQDFRVDFSKADDESLNAGDRHVYRNVRDVALDGSKTTCLSCHRIHGQSSGKHRLVLREPVCLDCHHPAGPRKLVKPYVVRNAVCEY